MKTLIDDKEGFKQWILFGIMWILYHIVIYGDDYLPFYGWGKSLFYIIYLPVYALALMCILQINGGDLRLKNIGFKLSLGRPIWYWAVFFFFIFIAFAVWINIFDLMSFAIVWRPSENGDYFNWYQYIIGVFSEEVLYRSVLCTLVAKRFGWKPAIAVSTIAFGAAHLVQNVSNVYSVVIGFLCSWSFYKGRTIILPLLIHEGWDLFWLTMQASPQLWERVADFIIVV